jgi:hypothetical protein
VLAGLFWLAVGSVGSPAGGGGFRLLVGIFTCFWLAAAVYPLVTRTIESRTAAYLSVIALGLALFAAIGPLLLATWARTDYVRFVWIIQQGEPCSKMGGGPGALFVLVSSWLVAIAATAYAIAGRLTMRRAGVGVAFGLTLCVATAAAMSPAPAVFAFVLGCVF